MTKSVTKTPPTADIGKGARSDPDALPFGADRSGHGLSSVWACAAASIHMISQTLPSGSSTLRLNMKP